MNFNHEKMRKTSFKYLPKILLGLIPIIFFVIFYFLPVSAIFTRAIELASNQIKLDQLIPRIWQPLRFSVWQAFLSTFFTALLGIPAAYIFARFKFPGKSLMRIITTIPFIMPTVVVAAGFNAFIGPNGWLNVFLMKIFNLGDPPIAIINTLAAIILAHVFYNTTVFIRVIGGAWAQLDRKLEYASGSLGASRIKTFLKITLPLLRPAFISAFLLVFLFDFTSFAVILMLGGPGFATLEVEIYTQALHLLNLPMAGLLSGIQLIFTLLLTSIYSWTNHGRIFQLTARDPNEVEKKPDSLIEKLMIISIILLLSVILILPLLSLVIRSFTQINSISAEGEHLDFQFTLQYYQHLFVNERQSIFYVPPVTAIQNSFVIGLITVIFALLLGYLASRTLSMNTKFVRIYDALLMLPLGTSAVTLGLGFLLVFNKPPIDVRSFPLLIPIAHTLVGLPFVIRIIQPALVSIPEMYTQSAALLGASPWKIWLNIELPILSRAFVSAGIFAFTISIGEFGATTFLSRPDLPTIPIAIYRYLSQPGVMNYGQAMAMATILMVICAMAIFLVERLRLPGISDF
ncbi:MAG: iron ABC transporter permease [Chloroflexi bacterium HGW-Chloroflexi-8]|nr:MAG: iron ABC transporter permease [Chloroflexi bacterium HGW-Chloroflexi-8]